MREFFSASKAAERGYPKKESPARQLPDGAMITSLTVKDQRSRSLPGQQIDAVSMTKRYFTSLRCMRS